MSGEGTFNGLDQQSKYFGFLASVFCFHVVYLVNKVHCKSLCFLQPLYVYQRLYFCSYSRRQMVIIKTICYRQQVIDNCLKFSVNASLLSVKNPSYCGCVKASFFLASVFCSHVVYLVNIVYCKSFNVFFNFYVNKKTVLIFCSYSKR